MAEPTFESVTQLGTKAEKFFGVVDSSSFTIQSEGWLFKRPFGANSDRGRWKKRYFVLKDSFLFWYKSPPENRFDLHPLGCLPLGGCGVFPYGMAKNDEFCFEITHSEFRGKRLLLKAESLEKADTWMQVLGECRSATWENAILGSAQLEKLRYLGTALEKKKKQEVDAATKAALAVKKEKEDRERVAAVKKSIQIEAEHQLAETRKLAEELEAEMEAKERRIVEEGKVLKANLAEIAIAEKRLAECQTAIENLDTALSHRSTLKSEALGLKQRQEMHANADIIRKFLKADKDQGDTNDIVVSLNTTEGEVNLSPAITDAKHSNRRSGFLSRFSLKKVASMHLPSIRPRSFRQSVRFSLRSFGREDA